MLSPVPGDEDHAQQARDPLEGGDGAMPRMWCVSGSRRHSVRSVQRTSWVAVLVVVAFGASACGGSTPGGGDAGTAASSAAYAGGPTGSSRDDNGLSEKTSRPLDPLAPARVAPVERPGPDVGHRLTARRV